MTSATSAATAPASVPSPYKDKFTLFSGPEAMEQSGNNGFYRSENGFVARVGGENVTALEQLPRELQAVVQALM